jgi:hypothetical protein
VSILPTSNPPEASAECGFFGELGLTPTIYGTVNSPVNEQSMLGEKILTIHRVLSQDIVELTLGKGLARNKHRKRNGG